MPVDRIIFGQNLSKSAWTAEQVYTYTCLFKLFPYELEISGVSWTMDKCKGREKCEVRSSTVFSPCATGTSSEKHFHEEGKWNKAPEAPPDHCSWGMFISLSMEEFASSVIMYFSEFWSVTGFCFVLDFRKYTSKLVTGSWSGYNIPFSLPWDTCLCNKFHFLMY